MKEVTNFLREAYSALLNLSRASRLLPLLKHESYAKFYTHIQVISWT